MHLKTISNSGHDRRSAVASELLGVASLKNLKEQKSFSGFGAVETPSAAVRKIESAEGEIVELSSPVNANVAATFFSRNLVDFTGFNGGKRRGMADTSCDRDSGEVAQRSCCRSEGNRKTPRRRVYLYGMTSEKRFLHLNVVLLASGSSFLSCPPILLDKTVRKC